MLHHFRRFWRALGWFSGASLAGDVEILRVQLTACGMAALAPIGEPLLPGQPAWSPSYQSVLELRRRWDAIGVAAKRDVLDRLVVERLDGVLLVRTPQGLYGIVEHGGGISVMFAGKLVWEGARDAKVLDILELEDTKP